MSYTLFKHPDGWSWTLFIDNNLNISPNYPLPTRHHALRDIQKFLADLGLEAE